MSFSTASRPPLCAQSYQADGAAGRRANVFRPPLTPATSTARTSYTSASGSSATQQSGSRKRSRGSSPAPMGASTPNARQHQARDGYFQTPFSHAHTGGWSHLPSNSPFGSAESPAVRSAASPPPFVDTRYNLAGGLDTPGGITSTRYESEPEWHGSEQDFRRQWDRAAAGEKQSHPSVQNGGNAQSWGQFAFNILSGSVRAAGKVLHFATKGAFTGFYAGGGQGYSLETADQNAAYEKMQQSTWEDTEPPTHPPTPFEVISTPVPGQYPGDSPPQERAAKRKKGVGGGWVMVDQPSPPVDEAHVHEAVRSRAATPNTASRRQSLIPRPSLSRATSRRSLAPTLVARRHSSTATHAGSPVTLGSDRPASVASQRSASLLPSPSKESYSPGGHKRNHSSGGSRPSTATGLHRRDSAGGELSPDAARYQERVMRQERQQEASMRKMNVRLKDMIREGKAALGTRVEVEEEMTDASLGRQW